MRCRRNCQTNVCNNWKHFTGPAAGANDSRMPDLAVEKGTIHTKRHSGEDPIKTGYDTHHTSL